jgi:hypothetical protein
MEIELLIKEIKKQVGVIINEKYIEIKPELEKAIGYFFEETKEKLEKWLYLYSTGKLTKQEFEWLLKSQKDTLILKGLQKKGIATLHLNAIKNSLLKIIFQTIKTLVITL